MDVSSLLNAPGLEDECEYNSIATTRRPRNQHSLPNFPTPSKSKEERSRIAGYNIAPLRKTSTDGEGLPLMELRGLDLDSKLGIHGDMNSYPMATSHAHRRFSESQSSFSSYAPSLSDIHSRNSSVTTIGGDNSGQSSFPEDVAEESRLGAVQEDTFMRSLGSDPSLSYFGIHGAFLHGCTGARISNTKEPLPRSQLSDATLTSRCWETEGPWKIPITKYVFSTILSSFGSIPRY